MCDAARSLSDSDFDGYLIGWRKALQAFLRSNPTQSLASRHAALADSFPVNFPNPAIVKLFIQPITSSLSQIHKLDLTCTLPDVAAIARQCELHFQWGTPQGILQIFERDILPAVLLHSLVNIQSSQHWPNPRSQVSPGSFISRYCPI